METFKERTKMTNNIEYYKCPFCKNVDQTNIPYGVCYECSNVGPKFVETLSDIERESFLKRQQWIKEQREKGIMLEQPMINTDKELWRERPGDYYANSIHVTECGSIGINCGGHVIVLRLKTWHELGKTLFPEPKLKE